MTFFYPDKPSAPRTFPDGLEKELGGPNTVSVSDVLQLAFGYFTPVLTTRKARKTGEDQW